MFNRMAVTISDIEADGGVKVFGLMLYRHHPDGPVNCELVAKHDSYALVDYWATMYNIGKADVDQCKEALSRGFDSVSRPNPTPGLQDETE